MTANPLVKFNNILLLWNFLKFSSPLKDSLFVGFCVLGAITFEQLERDHELQVRGIENFSFWRSWPSGERDHELQVRGIENFSYLRSWASGERDQGLSCEFNQKIQMSEIIRFTSERSWASDERDHKLHMKEIINFRWESSFSLELA